MYSYVGYKNNYTLICIVTWLRFYDRLCRVCRVCRVFFKSDEKSLEEEFINGVEKGSTVYIPYTNLTPSSFLIQHKKIESAFIEKEYNSRKYAPETEENPC